MSWLFLALPSYSQPTCENVFTGVPEQAQIQTIEQHLQEIRKTGWSEQKPETHVALAKTAYPVSKWDIVKIHGEHENYYLMDVGFHNLEPDIKLFQEISRKHFSNETTYSSRLVVKNVGERERAVAELEKWRWGFHDATLRIYRGNDFKKNYLNDAELTSLERQNEFAENSDVFGIILESSKKITELTQKEINQLTVNTIQLTYYDNYHNTTTHYSYQMPEGVSTRKPKIKRLPFMNRMTDPIRSTESLEKQEEHSIAFLKKINDGRLQDETFPSRPREVKLIPLPKVDISEFEKRFALDFAKKKVAEANRWSKPLMERPGYLQDVLWLKLFSKAESEGVEVIFASCDESMLLKLENSYGFVKYDEFIRPVYDSSTGELVKNTIGQKEFVIYLEVGSEKYEAAKQRMQQRTQDLELSKIIIESE